MPERSVIASLLVDNSLIAECGLAAEDFTEEIHQTAYNAIHALSIQRKPYDAVTLADYMHERTGQDGWLPILGGMVRDTPFSKHNFVRYVELIREKSIQRKARSIGISLSENLDVDKAITSLIALNQAGRDYTSNIVDALQVAVEGVEAIAEGANPGVMTGLKDMDRMLGGLHKSDLVVIAGRPSMGKTALMLNLVNGCSAACGVISAEQSREQIGQRFLAINGDISVHKMRTGKLCQDDWSRASEVMGKMSGRKIYINDKPSISLVDVQREARRWKYHNDIGVLFVDYLQKIPGSKENTRDDVSQVVVAFKNLARELDIPVVVLAQVKRDVDTRSGDKRPYMSDVAESGVIEREADQIITLYRDEVYNNDTPTKGLMEMIVCKNRHGPLGTINTTWIADYMQVKDYAYQWGQ